MACLSTVVVWAAAAPASAQIVVVGADDMRAALAPIFEDVRTMSPHEVEAEGFGGAHVLVIGRLLPEGPSDAFLERVSAKLERGVGLVLYWDGVALLLDGFLPTYRFDPSRQLGWYSGPIGAGLNLIEASSIALQDSKHTLWNLEAELPDELEWVGAPQFFMTLPEPDPLLRVVATFSGDGSDTFPQGSYPALLTGRACRSRVVLLPLNLSDVVRESLQMRQLVRSSVRWAFAYPGGPVPGPCPPDPDQDLDQVEAPGDNCPDHQNRGQGDQDADSVGDVCDRCPLDAQDDGDEDGFCANEDNCPNVFNAMQADDDGDGYGDVCDPCPGERGVDQDGDLLCLGEDNCPDVANPGQEDLDDDGVGDACDPDRDGDGLENAAEAALGSDPDDADSDDDGLIDSVEPRAGEDSDGDLQPNVLDPDSDNDGLPDGLEAGVRRAPVGTDLARGRFVPDADPDSVTDPLVADTDRGGAPDGVEDIAENGRVDRGEGDPNDPFDDHRFLPRDAGTAVDAADAGGDGGEPDVAAGPDVGVADSGGGDVRDRSVDCGRRAEPPTCPDTGCPECSAAPCPPASESGDGCAQARGRGKHWAWRLLERR